MFFGTWSELLRLVVVGTAAYAGLVLLLRVCGNRTQSKLNAFDLIVTVALGSTLSSVLVRKSTALAQGLAALALLIGLQYDHLDQLCASSASPELRSWPPCASRVTRTSRASPRSCLRRMGSLSVVAGDLSGASALAARAPLPRTPTVQPRLGRGAALHGCRQRLDSAAGTIS